MSLSMVGRRRSEKSLAHGRSYATVPESDLSRPEDEVESKFLFKRVVVVGVQL